MGDCRYCGQKAPFLKSFHPECKQAYAAGETSVWELALRASRGDLTPGEARQEIERTAADSFLQQTRVKELLVAAWEAALEGFLEDGIFDADEEAALTTYAKAFQLDQDDLNGRGLYMRAAAAGIIRELTEGKIPDRLQLMGAQLPINLQKSESLVFIFPQAAAYEERTKREYVGGHTGVGIRIAKGVYYRTGVFKGHPVDSAYLHELGRGFLALTTKHLYFHSPQKALRVPYSKVISFQPYDDGIGVMRDGTSPKPLIFVTGDGWATYNLAANLAQGG